jgi:hypothetical protein
MFAVPASHRGLSASQAAAAGRCAAVLLAAVTGGSYAIDPRTAGTEDQPARLQLTTSSLPRLDNVNASRLDMTLLPARRSGIGLALGVTSLSTPAPPGSFPPYSAASQLVDLGVHWRYTLDSHYRFDVTAWRRVQNADALSMIESHEPSYGARVEMGLGQSRLHKGFVADRGFVGLQLESGARIGVKRMYHAPMLYYRNKF